MAARIAITARGAEGLAAPLDPVFGRAAVFLIVDRESKEVVSTVVNPFKESDQGAGTGAAALMHEAGAGAVISGQFGPKAFQAMSRFDIEMWNAPEGITALEALNRFERGELRRMEIKRY